MANSFSFLCSSVQCENFFLNLCNVYLALFGELERVFIDTSIRSNIEEHSIAVIRGQLISQ